MERKMMMLISQRWRNKNMSAAYNRWGDYVEEVKRRRQLLARAAGRMAHRKLAGAFDAWCCAAEATRAAEARQEHVMGAVALRMAERGVCSAMARWHGVVVERRRQQLLIDRCCVRLGQIAR